MQKTFTIKGMHCDSCATLIERILKDKVNRVYVSFSDEKAEVDFDEAEISGEQIADIIKELGYEVK